MQAREGSVIRRGNLMAVLAEYTQSDSGSLWRYVIKREDTGKSSSMGGQETQRKLRKVLSDIWAIWPHNRCAKLRFPD